MTDWVQLDVIGGVSLQNSKGERLALGKKPCTVFAYLVLLGDRHVPRSHVESLFWEGRTEAQAQNSLRQALSDLRKSSPALGDIVQAGRDDIRLDHSRIKTDLSQVLHALQSGAYDEATIAKAALIRDNLLCGTDTAGAAYGDWLRDMRIRLHDQVLAPLLYRLEAPTADLHLRQHAARAALTIDPLCEPACRAAMQFAAEAGDMNRALSLYTRLFAEMERDLDMEPSQATQDLAVRVKLGAFAANAAETERLFAPNPVAERKDLPSPRKMSLGGQPVIVVLPFQPQGGEPIPQGLPEMLAEDIVCEMASVREMSVISMNSAHRFATLQVDHDALRSRLNADYALTAKLRRCGAEYRLSLQLCDTRTGLVVWARVVTATEQHLASAQCHLAEEIVNTLTPSLQSVEMMLHSNFKLSDLTAYHLTLRARAMIFDLVRDRFEAAGPLLLQAIAKEPKFAMAYQYLADWYSLRLGQGWSRDPPSDVAAMIDAARHATHLPGNPGRALAMLAHNLVIYARNYSEAMPLIERSTALAPNDAETIMWTGPAMAFTGQTQAAIDRGTAAI